MKISRRDLLKLAGSASVLPLACRCRSVPDGPVVLNDIHSKLNPTLVSKLVRPVDLEGLKETVRIAADQGQHLSVAGGRHAMGGQQFGTDTQNLDLRSLNRVLRFDPVDGIIEVESGIEWPKLIEWCVAKQKGSQTQWGIRQKQTGADRLTLGGALAANAHGRGLALQPIVGDIESLTLIDADGVLRRCSRTENRELFSLAIGGYGLFGVVYSIHLRLAPRRKLERVVEFRPLDGIADAFEQRIADGFLYGDFQFKTDESAADYLTAGVFSCYRPVPDSTPVPRRQKRLKARDWRRMLNLAHHDKARTYDLYTRYYMTTTGQIYWSDEHQLAYYLDDYHVALDKRADSQVPATEMISEVYVPRENLAEFMHETAEVFRNGGVNVIYGTVRMIEPDDVTFLPWARQRWACIVVNLHVEHSDAGIERAKREFRTLIDLATGYGGSFFLTYHRWATREQVETCYPEMQGFLAKKIQWDPDERFQSDWYRHLKKQFSICS
jgi:FAD/FMN-containing dehydrogenase